MTVQELLGRISSRELTEWQIYEREFGPFGGERLDILMAKLIGMLVRVNSDPKEQGKIKDSQFLIKWNDGGTGTDGDDS